MTQSIAHVDPDELPRLEWEDGWTTDFRPAKAAVQPIHALRCQACCLTDTNHIRRCLLPTGHPGPHLGQP